MTTPLITLTFFNQTGSPASHSYGLKRLSVLCPDLLCGNVLQSGQTTRHAQDSDDTASSRQHQPGVGNRAIAAAQTWSPGHLRSLAADASSSSKLVDPALAGLDFEEGGLSPWKGIKGTTELDLEAPLESGNAAVHRVPPTASKPG